MTKTENEMWSNSWVMAHAEEMLPMLIKIRRRLHQHPELGTDEV